MATPTYRRVYIEVVTREELTTPLSIDNMMFELCEHLEHRTAVVQLHVVDISDSLARLSAGEDLIPASNQLETPTLRPDGDFGHAASLYFACSALNSGEAPTK